MKLKKLIAAITAASLCCLLLSGCNEVNRPAEPKEITIIVKTPTQEMNCVSNPDVVSTQEFLEKAATAFAAQYNQAKVTFDVRVFAYVDEVKVISESFDTADAPDILFEAYFNMAGYIHTGRVVPLNDMITDEIRSDIDSAAWEISEINGKTYMMPYLYMQNILIYNKDLFRSCGLDEYCGTSTEIQSWSIEQWEDILNTLAANLPSNTYPLAMYGKNNQGDTHIMSYIRAFGSKIFDEEGNFDFQSPEAIKALTWIQDGVSKGWYAPHPENLEMKDNSELFANKQLAIYAFNNANTTLYDDVNNYGFVNYPVSTATSFPNGFEIFDNGDADKIRVAKDFIQFIYETDELLELSAGNLPVSQKVTEKYADRITMLSDFSKNSVNVVNFMNNSPNWQGSETSVRSVFYPHIHDLLAGDITPEECAQTLNQDCNYALKIGRENSTLHE